MATCSLVWLRGHGVGNRGPGSWPHAGTATHILGKARPPLTLQVRALQLPPRADVLESLIELGCNSFFYSKFQDYLKKKERIP